MKSGRRRRITGVQVARWAALYGQGLTARAIAAREGVGFGAVLAASGLPRAGLVTLLVQIVAGWWYLQRGR
jgi:hypothetical protein